jgi:hypothetical protein
MKEQGSRFRGWGLIKVGVGFLALLTAASAAAKAQRDEGRLSITVRLYNYAGVPEDVIRPAEERATRIIREAGVEIEWLDCPLTAAEGTENPACATRPWGPVDIAMRLLPSSTKQRLPFGDETLGFALLPAEGEVGNIAVVFWDDVERLAKESKVERYHILGHAMAHELGHLLLRTLKHADAGLMRAHWGPEELQLACRGLLLFAPREAARLRNEVRTRAAAEAF